MEGVKRLGFLLSLVIFYTGVLAQNIDFSGKKNSWILAQGNQYYENESYIDAIPFYEHIYMQDSSEVRLTYKLAVCYLYKPDKNTEALRLLEKLNGQNEKVKKKFPELAFNLAKAYHQNAIYDKAQEYYLEYQQKVDKEDTLYKKINLYINQCANGKLLIQRDENTQRNDVTLVKILDNVNTPDYEYMPIVTANEDKIIFTYRGVKSTGGKINSFGEPDPYGSTYDEDIFYSEKIDGKWSAAQPITELNTDKNDGAVALSPDGQTMIMYRNTADSSGNLYITQLQGETWTSPKPIEGFINTEYWEGSACLNHNQQMLIFSSDRPGGFGGRDLYISKKLPNGQWAMPTNMGANINTPYDEDAPFLFFDDKTLYFSTNGESSIGGFDIVYSILKDDGTWSKPINVGTTINTPLDNKFYTLTANGNKAFYSSMKSEGKGLQDIYVITPGHFANNQAFVLKGKTYLNDNIGEANISINTIPSSEMASEHYSNAVTGKYLLVFPAGWKYSATFSAPGYRTYEFEMDLTMLESFKDSAADIYLYTDEMFDKYMNISGVAYDSITGKPLAGVKVTLSSTDGSFQMETVTDENGNYIFRKVPKEKEYTIFVDYPGGAKLKGQVTDLYNQSGIEGVKVNEHYAAADGSYDVAAGTSSGTIAAFPVDYLIPYNKKNLRKNALKLTVEDYQKILERFGNSTAEGLVFRVQVGAYKRPKNFEKYKKKEFEAIDKLESRKYDDRLTRFSIGTYLTLNEAEKMKKIAKQRPPHDAFITVFYKGQRMLFSKDFMEAVMNK